MFNLKFLVGYICYLIRENLDDAILSSYLSWLSKEKLKVITQEVSRIYGQTDTTTIPLTITAYISMKTHMQNIFEMLWPVKLDIEHEGKLMAIRYIVSAQPDPHHDGWWYLRLPDWSIIRFKTDQELQPMHKLTFKTHMKEFFVIQRKLLREQRRWHPDMDNIMSWQQVMVKSELMGDGSYLSYSHEMFSAHQTGIYHLEDNRTRRIDYEWGVVGDPLDRHEKGKKVKALIAGKVPVDLGKLNIAGEKFNPGMLRDPKAVEYFWHELTEMVRWGEMQMDTVGTPYMFSTPKKLTQLFECCYMPEEVGEKFATRLGNSPYWKVKDKRRERWYIYSYDWRTQRKTFAHSVMPIGHIEPYRKKPGEYYFTMYSEDTLASRRQQSLWIAEYSVVLTSEMVWHLGLKPYDAETRFGFKGAVLRVSAYNDWAAQVWRQMGEPIIPKLYTKEELAQVPMHLTCT